MKVLFYPDPPVMTPGHTLSKTIKIFQLSGLELTNNIDSDWKMGVHWNLADKNNGVPRLDLDHRVVLNHLLLDVTKSNIAENFSRVFGYNMEADTSIIGHCVRKAERQSAHDGKIVATPCVKEPGYVYHKLIDTRIDIDMVHDLRVILWFGQIPIIIVRHQSIEGTFWHENSKKGRWFPDFPENHFTQEEIGQILRFCRNIGLDIGDLDVLRDNSTGKIYIVDVNNMPGGNGYYHTERADYVQNLLINLTKEKISCL